MKEIRMEVLNESEAIHLCNELGYTFIKCYEGKQANAGKLMMLALTSWGTYTNEETNTVRIFSNKQGKLLDNQEFEKYDTVVFAITSTGKMYIADKKKCSYGTTFNMAQAKLFKRSEAIAKAKNMTKRGSYSWESMKINR